MKLVHDRGARMHQFVTLVIVLGFFLNLVNCSINHNMSLKERNELK